METTKAKLINNSSHSATIDNEVAGSLYPTLTGIITSLKYREREQTAPDIKKIEFYDILCSSIYDEYREFYKFTNEQIKTKTTPISNIIKLLLAVDIEHRHEIIMQHTQYFNALINNNSGDI